jgi:hypothetical protein
VYEENVGFSRSEFGKLLALLECTELKKLFGISFMYVQLSPVRLKDDTPKDEGADVRVYPEAVINASALCKAASQGPKVTAWIVKFETLYPAETDERTPEGAGTHVIMSAICSLNPSRIKLDSSIMGFESNSL